MESGENSVQNFLDKSVHHLTNNNTIELNSSSTKDDDALTNNASQTDASLPKPNFFELIGGNENCDTETSDCNAKTILNNNDLTIGFVDDDDETNGETEGANLSTNQSNEAPKEYENNIDEITASLSNDIQKRHSSPPELTHIDEACSSSSLTPCSDVRRKSPTVSLNTETNVQSFESSSTGSGTKKKIRPNSAIAKSPPNRQDYFSIWTARESFDRNSSIEESELNENAPPLPPRNQNNASQLHRPLERSWPPRISRVNKPQQQQPAQPSQNENVFQFDIIDTDDPVNGVNDAAPDFQHVEFIPGEFFDERHKENGVLQKLSKDNEECAPLATPETDGSSEANILRAAQSKTPENVILKPLLKKKIGPDNYNSTILTQKVAAPSSPKNYNFPTNEGASCTNILVSSENSTATPCEIIPLKPHRPLSRQLSANNAQTSLDSNDSSKYATNHDEVNRHFILCRKPSLRSARQRSPPSGSSTRSASPLNHNISSSPGGAASPLAQINKVTRHSRSLTRTADTSAHMNNCTISKSLN